MRIRATELNTARCEPLMNRTFLFAIVCAYAIVVVAPAAAGVRLTEERNGALSVRVDFLSKGAGPQPFVDLPAMPQVPYTQFLVAIPPTGDFRVTMSGGRFEDRFGDLPKMGTREGNGPDPVPRKDGMVPGEPFDVVGPYVYRNDTCHCNQLLRVTGRLLEAL